jgi:NAD(P)-dependent dehydrogenase (short-subunit alcohol dehydrogenase family)
MLDRGIGAMICERFASEGCNIAINYLSSEDKAKEVASNVEKHSVKAIVIQGVRQIMNQHTSCFFDNRRTPLSVQTMQEWSKPRPKH